jgi:hypothetical protein
VAFWSDHRFNPRFVVGNVLLEGVKAINWEFLTTSPKGGLSGEGGISTTIGTPSTW